MCRAAVLLVMFAGLSCGEHPAIPVIPFSFRPTWLALAIPAPPGKGPEQVFGRLAAGDIVPIFDAGRAEVSDDGWWLALRGDIVIDLRRRAVIWRDENPSGSYASFDDRRLLRGDGVVTLETGRFQPYRHPDGGYLSFVIPDAGPRWGSPEPPRGAFGFTYRVAHTQWTWTTLLPPVTEALNTSPRHHQAWIADLANRRIVASLQTKEPVANAHHRTEISLALGLLAQPGLPATLASAMRTCGSLRNRIHEFLSNRLHEYRLVGDSLDLVPVPGAPLGIRRIFWSPSGTAVCTIHDGMAQTWTADWKPIARLPLLRLGYRDNHPAGPGWFSVTQDNTSVRVDCQTLQCAPYTPTMAPPAAQPKAPSPHAWASPDGIVARCGTRRVPIAPAELDWRQVRLAWQSDDLSLAAVLDATGRIWVTRLPDGQPRLLSGNLPKPPFCLLPAPGGERLLAITPSHITHLDVAQGTVVREVPITGKTTYFFMIFSQVSAAAVGGTLNGVDYNRPQAAYLRCESTIERWPIAIGRNESHQLDLESGRIDERDIKAELARVTDLDGLQIDSLGDRLADGRRIVALRRTGVARSVRAVVDPSGRRPTDFMPIEVGHVSSGDLNNLGGRVWCSVGIEGDHRVWNSATGGWVALYPQPDGSVVAWSDDGYLAVPRRYADALSIGVGGLGVRCSAFDLQINRPDKVLERIGLADPAYLALLREAWERRVRKLGLDPAKVTKPARYQDVPRLRLTAVPPGRTDAARIELACEVRTRTPIPLTVAVRVGGLAVGALPLASSGEVGAPAKLSVPVDLHVGLNRIELVPVLADGSSGVPAMAVVQRSGPAPRTRVVALGVSAYREPGRDLGFAAADARGLAGVLAGDDDRLVLTDREVVRSAMARVRSHLAAAQTGDLAVISVAAHGLVDGEGVYRIATHDTDFAAPQGQGIAIEELLEALRASPARRRLLLLDTCHAGEQDTTGPAALVAAVPDGRARGLRPKSAERTPEPQTTPAQAAPAPATQPVRPTAAVIARTMFLGSGWEDGVTVLAACRGDEASWESATWGHGAFSQAIIQGLGQARKQADADGDGSIDLGELGTFVMAEVPRMTGDQQHPEIRAGELDRDIVLLQSAR